MLDVEQGRQGGRSITYSVARDRRKEGGEPPKRNTDSRYKFPKHVEPFIDY